ncbi:hypothetical protein EW145_g8165, partial [Phellinidium pouzarii]
LTRHSALTRYLVTVTAFGLTISSLLGLLPHNSRTFPLDMENPWLPSSFSFTKSHPSPGHVRNAARRSRNAFIPVMAYATYLIMRLRHVAQENGWYEDRWARQLEEMEQFPPAWIQEVCLSQIVDMDTPRNGVFVRLSSCQFLKDVRTFINFGMPVWFVWDPMQQNTPHEWVNLIRPTTEELTNISMLTADTPMDISSAWGNPNPPTETVSASKPRKRNGAGQYKDETWQEFFACRAESNKKLFDNETLKRRAKREQREKDAEKKNFPGKKGARVFEWEESETRTGVLIRVPVSRASVEDIWDNYRASQKCYDGFCDEWDLCNEFDPTPRNYGPPTDEFDKDNDNWDAPAVTGQTFDNGLDALGPNKIVKDLRQQTGLLLENPGAQDEIAFDTVERMAALRFGFCRDGHAVSAGSSMVNPSSDSSTWKKTAKLLFVSVSEVDNVQKPLQEELIAFTQDVINSDGSLAKLHTRMHDLHFNSMAVSPRQRNMNFDIQVLTQQLYTEEPASQGSTSRARRSLTETTIYVLRPRIHSMPWLVAVLDPVAALQWLRLGRESIWDGCCHFMACGIPFQTITLEPPAQLNMSRMHIHDLGWRKSTRALNSVDYLTYEGKVVDLIKSNSRARAAVMRGGIVWRLVMHHLGLDDAVDAVMAGPTGDFVQCVYTTGTVGGTSQEWWDDQLTEDEECLICGVYKMYYGDDERPESIEYASWWPRASVWDLSSMNCGFWSSFAETWFRVRLQKIKENQASIQNQLKWRKALQLMRPSRTLMENNKKLAESYIGGSI